LNSFERLVFWLAGSGAPDIGFRGFHWCIFAIRLGGFFGRNGSLDIVQQSFILLADLRFGLRAEFAEKAEVFANRASWLGT
jgi:hypothetical protein